MVRFPRESFIPAGAQKVAHKGSSAVAYLYERNGRPYAVTFRGKADKPSWHHWFRTPADREARVRRFFEDVAKGETWKAEQAAARKAKLAGPHKLQVGHILVSSWGYDQTNVDFYEVIELVGRRSVKLRAVRQVSHEDLSMQGSCTPRAGEFRGEPFLKRVGSDGCSVSLTSYSSAYLWDGRPRRWSSYA